MFNPRRWEVEVTPVLCRVVDDAGTLVARVATVADGKLIRCAPDMHAFLVALLDSGVLRRDGLLLGEAERLRHRAEGLRD